MDLKYFTKATYRTFTSKKNGPSLYDLCDSLLGNKTGAGNAHLRQFYRLAVANLPLRILLSKAGLPQLQDQSRFRELYNTLLSARDDETPDWRAIGKPLAEIIDEFPQQHPKPIAYSSSFGSTNLSISRIDQIMNACVADLLHCYRQNGFIPAYAAFNLIGDADFRGRDLLVALEGLQARTYKNATFLFNLARVFLLANPSVANLINPPWKGIAEPMWEPVQIRHRSAYYDAFYLEALLDYLDSGLASLETSNSVRHVIQNLANFCVVTSREQVQAPKSNQPYEVVTALVPPPHSRLSNFFWKLKSDLGFGLYVPDCDTTACSFSAVTQAASKNLISRDALLEQDLLDFYAEYQVGQENHPTVTINDNIDFEGGIVTWIENLAGDRPFGNDLDPTLNLDVLEVSFRNYQYWKITENFKRLETVRRIIQFQDQLISTGRFANPRSHIYYLPELYCAYFGRCYVAFSELPADIRKTFDPGNTFEKNRPKILSYVCDEMITKEMNPFDAALALLALAKLDAEPHLFSTSLSVLDQAFGEGRSGINPPFMNRQSPYQAYEWNKMKTPTRILVGGPQVTSAFVLSALVHVRKKLIQNDS